MKYLPIVATITAIISGSTSAVAQPYVQGDVGMSVNQGQPTVGARIGYSFNRGFRLEVFGAFVHTDHTTMLGVQGYYDVLPKNKVTPFFGVGTGYAFLDKSARYNDSAFVSGHVGLRINAPQNWAISAQFSYAQSVENKWNNSSVMVGLRKSF